MARSSLLKGLRVLIVDDDRDTREMLKMVLEGCEAYAHTAASGPEALQMLKRVNPNVLISDIGMPQMDGNQLIRKIRSLTPDQGGQIPAAALTAYAGVEDRMRSLLAGYQIHLAKPVDPAELIAVVASLARRTQEFEQANGFQREGHKIPAG